MPLDAQVRALMDLLAAQPPLGTDRSPALARASANRNWLLTRAKPCDVAVEDMVLPQPGHALRLRLYKPRAAGKFPLLMFFHSGGFVVGSLDSHDGLCRKLCDGTDCAVLAVDYRLAPEHKFPAAPDDCLFATRWAAANADRLGVLPGRLAVAGDSAGGGLAAVTALRIRDEGGPRLRGQVMFYPVTDYHEPGTASYREFADGYGLSRADMIWFWSLYLDRPEDGVPVHAAPLRADLHDLPPALIFTAEFDPLRDEGEAYAHKLAAAGTPATLRRLEGMNHGFANNFAMIDVGRRAVEESSAWLRERFEEAGQG